LPWSETWKAYSLNFNVDVVASFAKLRIQHLPEARKAAAKIDVDPKGMRTSLKRFSSSTAIGSDLVHLKRLASLPDVALISLGGLMKQSVSTLTVPAQELLNILGLLGKKLGGSRTIAIMASMYRALMKHFGLEIREWDAREGHHWDSAIAGSSSLRAAILRALQCENATARGDKTGHLLWDMKQFYDSVHLPTLAVELSKRGYPMHVFILG